MTSSLLGPRLGWRREGRLAGLVVAARALIPDTARDRSLADEAAALARWVDAPRRAPVPVPPAATDVADAHPVIGTQRTLALAAFRSRIPRAAGVRLALRRSSAAPVSADPGAALRIPATRSVVERATGVVDARLLQAATLQAARFLPNNHVAGALQRSAFPRFTDLGGAAAEAVAAVPRAALGVGAAAEPGSAAAFAALARLPARGIGAAIAGLGAPPPQLLADATVAAPFTEAGAALLTAPACCTDRLAGGLRCGVLAAERREDVEKHTGGKGLERVPALDGGAGEGLGQRIEAVRMHGAHRSARYRARSAVQPAADTARRRLSDDLPKAQRRESRYPAATSYTLCVARQVAAIGQLSLYPSAIRSAAERRALPDGTGPLRWHDGAALVDQSRQSQPSKGKRRQGGNAGGVCEVVHPHER